MGGIIKVIAIFFSEKAKKSQSNSTVAGFQSTKINIQRYSNLKKTSDTIFGIEGASSSVWNWWFLAEALSPDKIVHGQVQKLCYSIRWAVVTRTAKLNI